MHSCSIPALFLQHSCSMLNAFLQHSCCIPDGFPESTWPNAWAKVSGRAHQVGPSALRFMQVGSAGKSTGRKNGCGYSLGDSLWLAHLSSPPAGKSTGREDGCGCTLGGVFYSFPTCRVHLLENQQSFPRARIGADKVAACAGAGATTNFRRSAGAPLGCTRTCYVVWGFDVRKHHRIHTWNANIFFMFLGIQYFDSLPPKYDTWCRHSIRKLISGSRRIFWHSFQASQKNTMFGFS